MVYLIVYQTPRNWQIDWQGKLKYENAYQFRLITLENVFYLFYLFTGQAQFLSERKTERQRRGRRIKRTDDNQLAESL